MQTICIANQKGGTGKTTTAINLATQLAKRGKRALLIDVDPQASLTHATLGDCGGHSIAEVIGSTHPGSLRMNDIIRPLGEGLDLAPGDIALASAELGITTRMGREWLLKRAMEGLTYDVAVVDCGPSLGLLVVNALAAAHGVVVPCLPTPVDLRGLGLFLSSLDAIRQALNPDLALLGVLLCQYEPRLKLHQVAAEQLANMAVPVFPVVIGRSVRAAEATGSGQALASGALGEQYEQLASEVMKWLK
jgi:chromosome partitioning protein